MATRYVLSDDMAPEVWQRVRNAQVKGEDFGLEAFSPSKLHDGLPVDDWMRVRTGEAGKGGFGRGVGRALPPGGMDGPSVMKMAAPRGSGVGRSAPKAQTPLMPGPRGAGVPRQPEARGRAQAPPDPRTLLPSTLPGLRHPNAISPIDPSRTEVFQPGPDGKLYPIPGWHMTGPRMWARGATISIGTALATISPYSRPNLQGAVLGV